MQLGNHRLTALPYRRFLQIQDNPIEKWQGHAPAQSCPTLCDPMDCSLSGSSVDGIFQARVLEWVAISFSRGYFQPEIKPATPALQADSLPAEPLKFMKNYLKFTSR